MAVQADGALQGLDRDVAIFPPGYLATAEFRVPESSDGSWLAEADFLDAQHQTVGKLQFAQIWKANPAIVPERSAASSKFIFWAAIAVVLILVFGKQLLSKPATSLAKGQARKDTEGGGAYVNNIREAGFQRTVTAKDLLFGKHLLLPKGKRNYVVLTAK